MNIILVNKVTQPLVFSLFRFKVHQAVIISIVIVPELIIANFVTNCEFHLPGCGGLWRSQVEEKRVCFCTAGSWDVICVVISECLPRVKRVPNTNLLLKSKVPHLYPAVDPKRITHYLLKAYILPAETHRHFLVGQRRFEVQ